MSDPYSLDVPNICFSLLSEDDSRHDEGYRVDRISRGFDDSETWSLDCTVAHFIIPRLKRFIEINQCYTNRSLHFSECLNKILHAFELVVRHEGARNWSSKEEQEVKEGLKLFSKMFLDLWW